MTTYRLKNKSMDCPVCGKGLYESESTDEVSCIDPNCKFNNKILEYNPYKIKKERGIV